MGCFSMINVNDFLSAIDKIVASNPTYRLGGKGKDGTCDCVGLIMGAMERVEKIKFPLHSSNYFSRKRMATLVPARNAVFSPGMLVYKAREDRGDLNARYKKGGKYYTGDLLDYYHAGVVRSISPFVIYHCTSSNGINGIAQDTSAANWTHAGWPLDIENDTAEERDTMEIKTALVNTQDGNPLKMRPTPSTAKSPITKIPNGTSVQVHADADGWAKVTWKGYTGYCMSKFLRYVSIADGDTPVTVGDPVTITLNRNVAEALFKALDSAMN